MRNNKGFTLVELVIIIIVLGILSAVAIPKYLDIKDEATKATAGATLGALQGTEQTLYMTYLMKGTDYVLADVITGTTLSGVAAEATSETAGKVTVGTTAFTFTYAAHTATAPGTYTKTGTNW